MAYASTPSVQDGVFWYAKRPPPLPPLQTKLSADVVVVGGGLMGLACAQTLAVRGRQVCLIEADTCGGGASGRSSGFITPDSELEFSDLVHRFGETKARMLWSFALSGVEWIRQTIDRNQLACDVVAQDAVIVALDEKSARQLKEENAARTRAGFQSEYLSSGELPRVIGAVAYHGGIRFGGTFGVDGYALCRALRDQLRDRGVRVFEQSPVTKLSNHTVETQGGHIDAAHVVLCTDRLLPDLGAARREIYHAQTFLALSAPLADRAISRLFPEGPLMVWDTALLYRYFRLTGDRRLLLGGGTLLSTYASHPKHEPMQVARRAMAYLQEHFPDLEVRLEWAWPGLIGVSKDFAPVVGRHPVHPDVRFASGAAGLPWAAALGRYLAEGVLGGRQGLDEVLSVDRQFPVGRAAQTLLGRRAAFALAHGLVKLQTG